MLHVYGSLIIEIHTKTQNRPKVRLVKMLLFCYVNLRFLDKDNTQIGYFLEDIIFTKGMERMMDQDNDITIDAINVDTDDNIVDINNEDHLENEANGQ